MKLDRQGLLEAGIAGATSGILVGCVVLSARLVTDAGDILGFFGGAFGAGAAVVGGMYLEDRKSKVQSQSNLRQIEGALTNVAQRSAEIRDNSSNHKTGSVLAFSQSLLIFKKTYQRFSTDDYELVAALEALDEWVDPTRELIRKSLESHKNGKHSLTEVYEILHPTSAAMTNSIEALLSLDYRWTGKAHDTLGIPLPPAGTGS